MAKTIRVNVTNKDSIDKAVRQLNDYAKKLKIAEDEIVKQLADIGCRVVEMNFSEVEPFPHYIAREKTPNGYAVVAYGEDVMFIEFGAGVTTQDYEHPEADLPPIVAGEWSRTEGSHKFATYGYWYYNHKKYTGFPEYPAHGFHEAKKAIYEQAEEVVRKVFSKYDRY